MYHFINLLVLSAKNIASNIMKLTKEKFKWNMMNENDFETSGVKIES